MHLGEHDLSVSKMTYSLPQLHLKRALSWQRLVVDNDSPSSTFWKAPQFYRKVPAIKFEGNTEFCCKRFVEFGYPKQASFRPIENNSRKNTPGKIENSSRNYKPPSHFKGCFQLFSSRPRANNDAGPPIPCLEYIPKTLRFGSKIQRSTCGLPENNDLKLTPESNNDLGSYESLEDSANNVIVRSSARKITPPQRSSARKITPPQNAFIPSPVKGILKSSSQSSYSSTSDEFGKDRKPSSNIDQSNDSSDSKTSKKKVQFHEQVTSKIILPFGACYWYSDKSFQDITNVHDGPDDVFNTNDSVSLYGSVQTKVTKGDENIHYIRSNDLPNYLGESKNFTNSKESLSFLGESTQLDTYSKEKDESEITLLMDCSFQEVDSFDHIYNQREYYTPTHQNTNLEFDKTCQTMGRMCKGKGNRYVHVEGNNTMHFCHSTSTPTSTEAAIKHPNKWSSLQNKYKVIGVNFERHSIGTKGNETKTKRHDTKWPKFITKFAKTKEEITRSKIHPGSPSISEEKTLRIMDWLEDVNAKGDKLGFSFMIPRPTLRRASYIGK